MNIQVQCCGIVLMLVLIVFYETQKKLHLDTGRAFFQTVIVALISIILDVLSIVAICHQDSVPELVVKIVCKSYLISLIALAFCTFYYICMDIISKRVVYRRSVYMHIILGLVGAALIVILPISTYYVPETRVVYTEGPSVLTAYACAFLYLSMNLVVIITRRAVMTKARKHAVLLWMGIWLGAALFQFLFNQFLVVGYASAIGMMILYMKLENPEMYRDRQTGLFSQPALLKYMQQLNAEHRLMSILVLVMEYSFYKNISQESEEAAEMEMIRYLTSIPGALVFKSGGDEVLLLFENEAEAEMASQAIQQRFQRGWGADDSVFLRPRLMFLPDSDMLRNSMDIPYLIKHIRQNSKELVDTGYLVIEDDMVSEMYETMEMEQTIFHAIERNWITINYQPIYSVKDKRYVAAEALVRITDETGRVVPPYDFVWVAEKNGMMLRLGEIIFEKVCKYIHDNHPEKYGINYIEINLSAIQCTYPPLADKFIAIMKKYQVSPKMINLEITESVAMGAKSIVAENMRKLIDQGVVFSLDDFGTGQSNLNYIVEMPVEIVKFDRTMIQSYFENGKAKYVMDAAMHMIQGMKLKIVAEGVESQEQYETMESLGIDFIQGFWFTKPILEEHLLDFLRENNH